MAAEDKTSLWTHPLESDGWYRAHNALRADMQAVKGMLTAFQEQVAAGKAIRSEQAAAASRFLDAFFKFLHHHHQNEDDIATPYLSSRFEMPSKICVDHQRLMELMDAFDSGSKKLLASTSLEEQANLLPGVADVFAQLQTLCLEHFKEEEEEAMPLMRKHFTPQEIEQNVVSKILRGMSPNDVGAFFRTMGRDEFRVFAKREGIPFFVRWILAWHCRGYNKKIWLPFEQQCLAAA